MLLVRVRIMCCVLALLAGTAAGAAAQDPPAPPANGGGPPDEPKPSYSWGVAIAGITQQQPYTGIKRFNFAIPLVFFENNWLQLMGPRLDIKVPSVKWGKEQELSFGAGVNLFGFNGYKPKDAPILNGMEERKNGIFAGPFAKWSNPIVNVTGEWMLDASRNSKGQRFSIGAERSWFVGQRVMLTPGASVVWLDEKYANYYYGVRSAEARGDRPAYALDGAVNVDFNLRVDYMFDRKQSVFVMLQHTALDSKIKDSPLVDRSSEMMLFVGYLYRFK
jgi:outer membrane protein